MQLPGQSLHSPASPGPLLEIVRANPVYVPAKQIALGSLGIVLVSQTIARRFSQHGPASRRHAPVNQKIVQVNRTTVHRCNQSVPTNRKLDRYILITDRLSLKCDQRPGQRNLRFDLNNHSRDQPNPSGHNRDPCRNLNLAHSLWNGLRRRRGPLLNLSQGRSRNGNRGHNLNGRSGLHLNQGQRRSKDLSRVREVDPSCRNLWMFLAMQKTRLMRVFLHFS